MEKLYALDASGYLYRSYFAIRNMTNAKGKATNALFGFVRSVSKLMREFSPDHLVAVFDGPKGIERRKALYTHYKAQRAATPDDLREQIGWAQEWCEQIGIPLLVVEGVEADDTLATLAKRFGKKGCSVFLCSGDKDLCQLVNEQIFILNTHKENLLLDRAGVKEQYGVFPEQVADFLAIVGDASDNIPGLSGFGPKTAAGMLERFGSLEELLDKGAAQLSGKKAQTIEKEREQVLLSKQLVLLDCAVEIPIDEVFYEVREPDLPKLKQFYTEMGFRSLLRELGKGEEDEACHYQLIDDEEAFSALLKKLQEELEICVDTETTSMHPLEAELVGIGLGCKPKEAWYLPLNGKLGRESILSGLRPLFANPRIRFYGHNIKYDLHVLKEAGVEITNLSFDTLLASYLLNAHQRGHSLDELALGYFGYVKTPISDLLGKGKLAITMDEVAVERVCHYCCEDVDYTCRLRALLGRELEERGLSALFFKLEMPLLRVLAKMEERGIFVDTEMLKEMGKQLKRALSGLEEEIYAFAGEEFNINSPKQLGEILFEKLNIPAGKRTATGYSTNASILEGLKADYPIVAKVIEYRMVEKLRSTYIDALPKQVLKKTGRIHCSFNQSVAATGRLSSQDPNLQNIPVRTALGREIRRAFRPQRCGWSFLSADYSQIELRILAHLSEDPALIAAFEAGEDIHTYTASLVLNIPLEKVTKKERHRAKAVNFGIIYGQQAFGLSRELGISVEEAKSFIESYFERYPKVQAYVENCKSEARKSGKAVTITGRERQIPEINSSNRQIREAAERLAVNTPLQGTAADLIKMAMVAIDQKIEDGGMQGFVVLQIHDELIIELPDEEVESFTALVQKTMEGIYPLRVPLVVDVAIGKNWKEC